MTLLVGIFYIICCEGLVLVIGGGLRCVSIFFSGSLSFLLNGCPTEEICFQKGIKQGYPLAQFLFLLFMEGLSSSLKKWVLDSVFQGFKMGSKGLEVSHFQYVNDTILVGCHLLRIF